jgi:hypothetical protein
MHTIKALMHPGETLVDTPGVLTGAISCLTYEDDSVVDRGRTDVMRAEGELSWT